MNRKECLEAAGIAVLTDRETDYGSPEDTFSDIRDNYETIHGRNKRQIRAAVRRYRHGR